MESSAGPRSLKGFSIFLEVFYHLSPKGRFWWKCGQLWKPKRRIKWEFWPRNVSIFFNMSRTCFNQHGVQVAPQTRWSGFKEGERGLRFSFFIWIPIQRNQEVLHCQKQLPQSCATSSNSARKVLILAHHTGATARQGSNMKDWAHPFLEGLRWLNSNSQHRYSSPSSIPEEFSSGMLKVEPKGRFPKEEISQDLLIHML